MNSRQFMFIADARAYVEAAGFTLDYRTRHRWYYVNGEDRVMITALLGGVYLVEYVD